ncbi:MAG: class I SAM-dependent methyltransferase [Candidatus Omnitrophica bacterium]|nr:class I SAM-dependent methyltransferase [Candidatus Omnitrophota bacterium]
MGNQPEVPADIYDKNYYLTDNEGFREYTKGLDRQMHSKYQQALELGAPKAGDIVLDIGCGRAELVYYCAKRQCKALGIDYSQAAIDIAQGTLKQLPPELQKIARVQVADVVKTQFPDKYNVVFMIDIVEHMYDWQLQSAFEKINAILAEDGRLIISTPNYYYEKYLSPLKRMLDIPFLMVKIPLRVLRGKFKPTSFIEVVRKIFRVWPDRGATGKQMHVNVMTPGILRKYFKDFDAKVYCHDPSVNPLTFLLRKWWGREIVVIARKRKPQ